MDKIIGQKYKSVVAKVTANGVDKGAHGLYYKYEYEMHDGTVLSARHKSEYNKLPEGTEVEYVIRGSNDYGQYGGVSKPFNGDRSNGMPYSPNNDVSTKRLTPSQCEGLQGSHDDLTKRGTEGMISDRQRYNNAPGNPPSNSDNNRHKSIVWQSLAKVAAALLARQDYNPDEAVKLTDFLVTYHDWVVAGRQGEKPVYFRASVTDVPPF